MRFLQSICFVVTVAAISPGLAQDATEGEASTSAIEAAAPIPGVDLPPSRVGGLNFRSGNIGFRAPGQTGWSDAQVNQPAYTGAAFRTDPQARAEIHIGANAIDLAGNSEIEITALRDQITQFVLSRGRIDLNLRRVEEAESVEIDTPRGGIWLLGPGKYDIDAGSADQPLRIAVSKARRGLSEAAAIPPSPPATWRFCRARIPPLLRSSRRRRMPL